MKNTRIYQTLLDRIDLIRHDYERGASKSFLARKYDVSRPTILKFLKEEGKKWDVK